MYFMRQTRSQRSSTERSGLGAAAKQQGKFNGLKHNVNNGNAFKYLSTQTEIYVSHYVLYSFV